MAEFDKAIPIILDHEGGFSDDSKDPGGVTKYGISLRYLKARGDLKYDVDQDGEITENDIKNLTRQQVIDIYQDWWNDYQYNRFFSQNIATKVFDSAVNMGQKQAVKMLQDACNQLNPDLNLQEDGVMGPITLIAANQLDSSELLNRYRRGCGNFYSDLIARNSMLGRYEAGWLRRAYS